MNRLGGKKEFLCSRDSMACPLRVEQLIFDDDIDMVKACDCLPECNSIEYHYEIINDRILEDFFDDFHSRSSVSVYFSDNEFLAYKRSMSFGIVSFLSNVGGLLGLFLGVSFLSVIETVYLLAMQIFHKFQICNI